MDDKQVSTNEFTPPRHWVGLEELNPEYWSDPQVQERRGQEFHDKPVETIAAIDQSSEGGMVRRDFLALMGASMAMASFACARRPVHKIIPYVVKPEEVTPGVANYYASTAPDSGYGLLVRTREGRPIKLEGNPDHPLNKGRLSARGQAALLDLYDPDRLKEPLSRNRAGGSARPVSWKDADAQIQEKLKAALASGGKVRILTEPLHGESARRLIQEFLSSFGAGAHVEYSPLFPEEVALGQAESYGTALIPTYRFDQAQYVLSLSADFLGTWISPVEYASDWIKGRKLDGKTASTAKMSKLVVVESGFSVTGSNADERVPVRPGDELKVALAIAHEIVVARRETRFAGDAQVTAALAGYKPETVATDVRLNGGAGRIKKIAQELLENRGKGLVVAGGIVAKDENALALQIVVNFLNSALDHDGVTVDGVQTPVPRAAAGSRALSKLVQDMKAGLVDVLIIHRANPAYAAPQSLGFEEALKKVPFVVYSGEREVETSQAVDFVLPDHHFLENWGDARLRKDLFSLQQPVIAPIHGSRAFEDCLLTWIKGAGLKATGSNTWHDYLMAQWKQTVYREYGAAGSFEQFWESALRLGVFDGAGAKGISLGKSTPRPFKTQSLAKVPGFRPGSTDDVLLALYPKVSLGDGSQANNPWLQELPDPVSRITWDNYLNVSPGLAKKLGVSQNDVVEVSAAHYQAELPVNVQVGLHDQSVTVAVGYGRKKVGKVGEDAGVNAYPFAMAGSGEWFKFSGHAVKLRKTGKLYKLASTQWHNVTENRPIINDLSLATFKKAPGTSNHTDPHLRMETVPSMWPSHEYKGYRWGMAIDLTSCIGCGACVIGCQAENNIPTVGRNNVRVSREMHWIRIDRYYSGDSETPDVVFQPMLCQHCENAPCETVCPVLATVHDDEGLNVQAYNRCVGTRYCQNNCPYKVRRFNFFDHWKSYEGVQNLVWNPDVTVRSRGIMEKCTFCVQRLHDAKWKAKDQGEKVKDHDIKVACQQTCPTDAIVFGDMNDPNSRVSRLKTDPRAFRVLEVLNTKPSISYMSKVRNKEDKGGHGGHHA